MTNTKLINRFNSKSQTFYLGTRVDVERFPDWSTYSYPNFNRRTDLGVLVVLISVTCITCKRLKPRCTERKRPKFSQKYIPLKQIQGFLEKICFFCFIFWYRKFFSMVLCPAIGFGIICLKARQKLLNKVVSIGAFLVSFVHDINLANYELVFDYLKRTNVTTNWRLKS